MNLSAEELRIMHQALNEVLNGPDAIEDWEFHPRMGVERAEAAALLDKVERIYEDMRDKENQPRSGGIR